MRVKNSTVLPAFLLLLLFAVSSFAALPSRADLVVRFADERPKAWGTNVAGVLSRVKTDQRIVALTFDACDGRKDGYDAALIDFLVANKIPATLFVNARWIDAHEKTFRAPAANPLFEIENHGARHRPLSVAGRGAYGIEGTKNIGEAYDEVEGGARRIEALTGRRPRFFRAGTAHYDDVAARLVRAMGFGIAGFAINGDGGGTYSSATVGRMLLSAKGGEIVLLHMNRPGSGTLPGLKRAIPALQKKGFRFLTLSELLKEANRVK